MRRRTRQRASSSCRSEIDEKKGESAQKVAQLGDMAPSKGRSFSLSDPHTSPTMRLVYKFGYVYLPLLFESIVAISATVSTFMVIYQAVYHAGLLWQWALIYGMDVIYVAYIVYRFFRPFKKRGELVTDKKKIVMNYIRSSFLPDLLSVIPLEIFSFASTNPIYIAAFLRLNRCIRCYKVWGLLSSKEKELDTNTVLLKSLRFIFLAVFSVHVAGGVWFFLSCHNAVDMDTPNDHDDHHSEACREDTWGNHEDVHLHWDEDNELHKYIVSLYWAVTTISSVGYGDILPNTPEEKWVATVCMLWGVVLFGYILGDLASLLTNADAQRSKYIHRLNTIREHLKEAGVSEPLRKKVLGYYEYLWHRNKGKAITELFDELPLAFQAELSLETYRAMIDQSTLFKGAPEEFMRMLSLAVKHMLYLPQQVILNKGDIGHHMYFISMGEVEILPNKDAAPLGTLREGDTFGEINLVHGVACAGVVRAKTHCDILLLSKADAQHILQHFPEVFESMKEEVSRRCDMAFAAPPDENSSSSTASTLEVYTSRNARKRSSKGHHHHHRHHHHSTNAMQNCIRSLCSLWNKFSVVPGTKFAIIWELLIIAVTLIVAWIYSFEAGFGRLKVSISYGGSAIGQTFFGFTYLLDLLLVADIFVSMKKAIVTPTEVITSSQATFFNYVKSFGFFLDVLAVLPLEIFALVWLGSGEDPWGYVALLRTNRLIKLWKVVSFFSEMEASLYISMAYVNVLKFSVYILTATHFSACIWFLIACFSPGSSVHCSDESWASEHVVSPSSTIFHDYLISVYWAAATTTTVGYGDISAHTPLEMMVALVVQLLGVMLYGYCLGAIAASLTNVVGSRVSFQEKVQVVHQFMFDHKLGQGLLKRVDHYFTLLWGQYKGETVPGGLSLIHDMPQSVREDVSMEECADLLSNIPFFKHVDNSFLREVSLTTSVYLFAPGDMILYSGDMGREMYCIRKGYIEILAEDLSQVVSVQGPGSHFGELGFLFGAPRMSTIRAATHCQLVMLNKPCMDKVLEHFPLIAKQFDALTSNTDHLKDAQKAVLEASARAMNNPRRFTKPCTMTALAVAMATPLSIIIKTSIANTIIACVGGKDEQSKLAGPISIGETYDTTLIKFSRKEFSNLLSSDQEKPEDHQSSGLRHRGAQSRSNVATSSTSVAEPPTSTTVTWEDQQPQYAREEEEDSSVVERIFNFCEKVASYCIIPYTFLPNTKFGKFWEGLISVTAFITVLTVSLQAGFVHAQPALWTINYLFDIIFLADMVLKVHTAFYNSEGVLITQPVACALHYFKTNFVMDLICNFPTDIIVLAAWTGNFSHVLRVLSLARLNRVLRLYKMPLAFDYLESQITRSSGLITELKFAAYMCIFTHLTACGWFLLACASLSVGATDPHLCNVGSWALQFSETPLNNFSIPYQYIVSLYWATATTTTVGYGDIGAHTDLERAYATFVMIIGVVAYGYIIASVAAGLANADSGRAQYQDKLKAIKSYLKDQDMDTAITRRVINYYEYIWQRNKGVSFSSLFQGMPISLQADISLSLYKKIIDQVPLFQNTEIGFTKLLALSIKPVLFLSQEYVVRKGDIGSEMFFINHGTVEVVSEDGTVVFATLGEGKFFGEISLVFSCPRTASIRAGTNCDLFMLTKTDLDTALSYYPHIEEQIKKVAGNRANLVKKRSQIAAKAAAEGKSAADAAKAAAQGTKNDDDDDEDSKQREKEKEKEKEKGEEKPETATVPSAPAPASTSAPAPTATPAPAQSTSKDEETEQEAASVPPRFECGQWMKTKVWPPLKKLLTFTVKKEGVLGTALHLLGCLMAYLSAFIITYQACFQNNSPILWSVNYIFEAYFLFEMFMKFHLAYKDAQGTVVTDFKSIVFHYLKDPSGFLLDSITIFPFELIGAPIQDEAKRTAAVLYLKLPHVIRIIRIQWFFSEEEKRLNQKTLLLRLLKFIVLISICTHFVACIWYMLGCQADRCQHNTWAVTASLVDSTASDADHYCNSLYWAVATMTTTGYGDISATNVQEMIYAICVMVIGKLLFGFILGSIASTLANLDTQRVLFEEKFIALKEYMHEQQLSSLTKQRVMDFFDYLWVKNNGTDRQTLLADMPYCMQAEVSMATTEPLMRNVSIFATADAAFLRHLTLMMKPCLFLPGEYIVHKGDMGLGMFFLYHGSVEVVNDESGTASEVLTEGSSFGVKSLLYNSPMESSACALSHVDMFTISHADFQCVLEDHPSVADSIAELAAEEYGKRVSL